MVWKWQYSNNKTLLHLLSLMNNNNKPHFSIEEIVFNTAHHAPNGKNIKTIAGDCGAAYNYFSRMVNPTDEQCNLPVSKIIPLMKSTDDFTLLKHLALHTGHLIVPMPRGLRKGTNPRMPINEYAAQANELVMKLYKFLAEPSDEKRKELDEIFRKHMGDSENMRRRVNKHDLKQQELF